MLGTLSLVLIISIIGRECYSSLGLSMFLTLIPHFTITIFTVMLIVMQDPTGKNTTDVLKLTSHYFILAVYLVQGLMMY